MKQGETIELDDFANEIKYWRSAVVCYVLGAHPPFTVVKGYIHRLWAKHGLIMVLMLKYVIILVRFDNEMGKN